MLYLCTWIVIALVAYVLGDYRGWKRRGELEEEITKKEVELETKKAQLRVTRDKPWSCEQVCPTLTKQSHSSPNTAESQPIQKSSEDHGQSAQ